MMMMMMMMFITITNIMIIINITIILALLFFIYDYDDADCEYCFDYFDDDNDCLGDGDAMLLMAIITSQPSSVKRAPRAPFPLRRLQFLCGEWISVVLVVFELASGKLLHNYGKSPCY